ncbi:MAG: type III pantothenate kinase [Myxococcales bacterium]|nr:MAG: type III pantothenate kinase [Myxococcales bacterium]
MLMVIDIGNTNIVLGLYEGSTLVHAWRIATKNNKTDDEYGAQIKQFFALAELDGTNLEGAIIACVVPPLLDVIERMCKKYFGLEPIVIGPGSKTGMPILYDNPREVGADRIVNSVAGFAKWKQGLILVDFGTATTFDCVSPKGEYMGGVICPGIGISAEALFLRASKLPRIEISAPKATIGKTTVDSMRAGLVYGYVAMVDGLVHRIKAEMPFAPKVIATGGLAAVIAKHSTTIEGVDDTLTLEGLRLLYELNRK